jgi:hypothetical protein
MEAEGKSLLGLAASSRQPQHGLEQRRRDQDAAVFGGRREGDPRYRRRDPEPPIPLPEQGRCRLDVADHVLQREVHEAVSRLVEPAAGDPGAAS